MGPLEPGNMASGRGLSPLLHQGLWSPLTPQTWGPQDPLLPLAPLFPGVVGHGAPFIFPLMVGSPLFAIWCGGPIFLRMFVTTQNRLFGGGA